MKCPKCGYVSHDYLDACRKCSVELGAFKAQMQLYVVQAGHIDLRSVLGGAQPSPLASGEYEMGDSLFGTTILEENHGSDGFDISLDDDFSFTPSAMSLESLDGFELSAAEALSNEQSAPPADTGDPETGEVDPPDTGYATVVMDVGNMDDEAPSIDPGNLFDEPIESAVDSAEISIGSLGGSLGDMAEPPAADAGMEMPELPPDDMLVEPDLASADLRSSIMGRTSDLDLTSMELKRTTRDIEMLNQLKAEPEAAAEPQAVPPETTSSQDSGDLLIVDFDGDDPGEAEPSGAGIAMPDVPSQAAAPSSDDVLSAELAPDTTELAFPALDDNDNTPSASVTANADLDASDPDGNDTASYAPSLPGSFPDEADDPENLNNESGELVLPSLDTHFLAPDATASPLTDSTVRSAAAEPLEMPELPENAGEEPAPSMYTEEMTLTDNDLTDLPPPLEFPSIQTGIYSPVAPEEATIVDEQSVQIPEQPATELELGNPDSPKQADAFLAATPEEATIADEQSPPLTIEPVAEPDAATPPEAPIMPELPELTDALMTPSPEEATIVDEQPPQLPTGHTPPDTGETTVELETNEVDEELDEEADHELMFPDEPEASAKQPKKPNRNTDA